MEKNEFKELFNKLYNITKESTYDLAEHFSVTPKTVIKWLDGKSVPATMVRSAVIKKLYEEQQKKEQAELIGKIIKELRSKGVVIEENASRIIKRKRSRFRRGVESS